MLFKNPQEKFGPPDREIISGGTAQRCLPRAKVLCVSEGQCSFPWASTHKALWVACFKAPKSVKICLPQIFLRKIRRGDITPKACKPEHPIASLKNGPDLALLTVSSEKYLCIHVTFLFHFSKTWSCRCFFAVSFPLRIPMPCSLCAP